MNKCGVLTAGILLCLLTGPLYADDMQGVAMKDGTMMTMADGKATGPMQKEMTTTDGQKVTTDGTVTKADGTTSHLQNGQMMTKDGKMMNAHEVKDMEKGMQMKDKGMGMGKEKMKQGMGMGKEKMKDGMGGAQPSADTPNAPTSEE